MKSTIKQQVSYFLSAFAFIFVLFVGMQIGFAAIRGGQYNESMINPSSPTHAMGFLSSDDPLPTKVGSLILKDFNTSAHSYLLGNSTYQNDCISHKAGAEKETCLEATGNGAGYGFFNLLSALDNNTQQMITLANGSASGGKVAVTPSSNSNPSQDADFVEEQFSDGNDSMLISSLAMKDANGNFAPSDPNHLRPVCVDAQGMLTTDCGAGATVSYSCSGTIVNGQMCSGDNQDLTQNGTWHAVENCGADKCEYTCDSGYHEENGICVSNYHWIMGDWGNCTGTSGLCSGSLTEKCEGQGRIDIYSKYTQCYGDDCETYCVVSHSTSCQNIYTPGVCNSVGRSNFTSILFSPITNIVYAKQEDQTACPTTTHGSCHWVEGCSSKNGTSKNECESYDSSCSWTPGVSTKTRTAVCVDQNNNVVDNSNCDPTTRPADETVSCGGYHWDTGDWGQCKDHYCDTAFPGHFGWCSDIENQQNCEDALGTPPNDPEQPVCEWKSSPNPVRTRAVQCVDQSGTVVADSNCSGTKPSDTDECKKTVRIYIAAHCNGSTKDQCCTNYIASDEIYMLDVPYNSDTSDMFDYNSSGKMSLKHSNRPGVLEVPVGVTYPFHPDSYTQGGSPGFGYSQSELLAVKTAGAKVSTSDGKKALIHITKEPDSNNAYIDNIYFCPSSSDGGSGSGHVDDNHT